MKALDTNVLVRFLVRDDEQQSKAVYRKFKQTEADKEVLFIPALVVLESRQEILNSLDQLTLMPILEFEAQSAIRRFVASARENKADLSDLLIAHYARVAGCECVITFDKTASNLELFELLE
jgi:predicted nucleic-acid-binding protein